MIEVKNLVKSFDSKIVLNNLTFSIARNSVYGLLGPNGAGKTTTINILCNLLDADSGSVTIDGNPSHENRKRLIGVVPQEISVYQELTCKENLFFFARLYGLTGSEKFHRIDQLIQILNLGEYINTKVSKLSGGWRRRVHIAVALVHSPIMLILDEPTAGLDLEARHELWGFIQTLKSNGVSILLTTHQLDEAERLCSRIGIMKNGNIIAEGSVTELRSYIPAKQIAVLESDDNKSVCTKVESLGWTYRHFGGRIILYLPERYTLKTVVDKFESSQLKSISLQEVGLEHIYKELTSF